MTITVVTISQSIYFLDTYMIIAYFIFMTGKL